MLSHHHEVEFLRANIWLEKATKEDRASAAFRESVTRMLLQDWNRHAEAALKAGVSQWNGQRTVNAAAQVVAAVQSALRTFGARTLSTVNAEIAALYEAQAAAFLRRHELKVEKAVLRGPGLAINFTLKDREAIAMLQRFTRVSAGTLFPEEVMGKVAEVTRAIILEEGQAAEVAAVTIREELEKELTGALGLELGDVVPEFFATNPEAYFEILANNASVLSQNTGRLIGMQDAGVTRYRVAAVIDEKTSEICKGMNGRILNVSAGMGMLDSILGFTAPQQLKDLFPWDSTRSELGPDTIENNNALAAEGLGFPPYHGNCYDEQTEVYTSDGFTSFKDVKVGDQFLSLNPATRNLEWVSALEKQEYDHKGNLVHVTNEQGSLDMMVTMDHTMFGYRRVDHGMAGRNMEPVFDSTEKFFSAGEESKFYVSSEWVGDNPEFIDVGVQITSENYCRLLAFYLSDGYLHQDRYPAIANTRRKEIIHSQLSSMGFKNVGGNAEKTFIYDSRLTEYFSQFGYCNEKFIPPELKTLSAELLQIFLDSYVLCDGHEELGHVFKDHEFGPRRSYFTTSKRLADDLGEVLIRAGKSASYSVKPPGTFDFPNGTYSGNYPAWTIREIKSEYRQRKNVQLVPYDGKVYDVTLVKNHTLLTRRNGCVVWGSNCRTTVVPEV